jgi:hypothetical protein
VAVLDAPVVLGALYSDSAIGVLRTDASITDLMVSFPISLIQTFFFPLFIVVHRLIFRRIGTLATTYSPRRAIA